MGSRKPKLMLDTNIPGVLVSAYQADLELIVRCMNREFQIISSPQTHIELMNGILNGDGDYFEIQKERIRIMVGTGTIRFVQFPGTFAFQATLNRKIIVSPLGESDFRRQVQLVLHAKSLATILKDEVKLPFETKSKRWGFNPEIHQRQHRAGIDQYKLLLERVRETGGAFPPRWMWASDTAKTLKQSLTKEEAELLGEGLDAAYEYDRALCATVTGSNYNIDKNEGDWIDGGQLFYLSDPSLNLLTDDQKLKSRASKSSQASRILNLREFLRDRGFDVRH
jgi:hypothetical protein